VDHFAYLPQDRGDDPRRGRPGSALVADQLGHSRPSMTQDVYMGRRAVDSQAALALEAALRDMSADRVSGGFSVAEEKASSREDR
jgi:integrase